MAKYVGLLGSAPSSLHLAPFGNSEWEFWGCSPGVYGVAPRTERFFELHRYEPGQPWFSEGYCDFLKNHPCVYVAEERSEIPNGKLLPLQDMIRKYSPYFFTSTLAYMMALAIEEGFEKIGLWGVDMAAATEYKDQRLGCQYFALLARARGIEVGVPPESDLFRPAPLYGVSEVSHARIKMMARRRELEGRVAAALQTQQQAKDESLYLRGALEDLEWCEMDWMGNIDSPSSRFLSPPPAAALQQFHIDMHEVVQPKAASEMSTKEFEDRVVSSLQPKGSDYAPKGSDYAMKQAEGQIVQAACDGKIDLSAWVRDPGAEAFEAKESEQ